MTFSLGQRSQAERPCFRDGGTIASRNLSPFHTHPHVHPMVHAHGAHAPKSKNDFPKTMGLYVPLDVRTDLSKECLASCGSAEAG
jgi:hypothetical protein